MLFRLLLYFLISVGATTVGSMTGIGGGVIIKPLLDVLHGFDVETIGVLSSVTVFSMSLISVGRHMAEKNKIPYAIAVALALGSVAGGFLGQHLLTALVAAWRLGSLVTAAQNALLVLLILAVIFYMKNKSRIGSLGLRRLSAAFPAGVFLGVCSSFLGIGGGPINVALMIYLFSFDTKTAAICSLVTILFSQISKLGTVALTTGFAVYDLSVLPAMVAGAVAGGFAGSGLHKKCGEATVEKAFHGVQLVVLLIAVSNIVKSLAG